MYGCVSSGIAIPQSLDTVLQINCFQLCVTLFVLFLRLVQVFELMRRFFSGLTEHALPVVFGDDGSSDSSFNLT